MTLMRARRLRYYCRLFFRDYLVGCPAILLESVVRQYSQFRIIGEIRVVDPTPLTFGRFTNMVNDSLALIAKSDARRFRRIQIEIRNIINAPAVGGYNYGRPFRVCCIDLRCLYDEDEVDMTIKFVASVLVYLATRGRLYSLGILETRQTKARLNSLCCKEAQRFMQRLGMSKTPWDTENLSLPPKVSYLQFIKQEVLDRVTNGKEGKF